MVLAAIVSWYRPGRDGNKRYKDDLPWLSYKFLSDDLGLTEEVIRNAAAYLEDRGLIRRVLIDFMGDKTFLANVLHFELYLDALEAINQAGRRIGDPPSLRGDISPLSYPPRRIILFNYLKKIN